MKENNIESKFKDKKSILYAFNAVKLMANEQDIEAFIDRWGGIDLETCFQVLKEGQGEDPLIAIFLLGTYPEVRVSECLLSLLQSSQPLERWASALVLGKRKEEKALPVLIELLTEDMLVDEQHLAALGIRSDLYTFWRPRVIRLLDEWQRPELAPHFRGAFRLLWQTINDRLSEIGAFRFELLCTSMDELTYALGRLHAFGALMDLPITACTSKIALFHMACGHLSAMRDDHGALPPHQVLFVLDANPLFKQELQVTLQQYFGLSKEEQAQVIDEFYMNSIQRFEA